MMGDMEEEASGDLPLLIKLPSGEYLCPVRECSVKDRHRKIIGRHLKSNHRGWATRHWEFMWKEFKMAMVYFCENNCREVFTRKDNAQRHASEGRCKGPNDTDTGD